MIEHIAAMSGKSLVVFPLNADIDTMDLVGGFEQVDPQRAASSFLQELRAFISARVLASLPGEVPQEALAILELLENGELSAGGLLKELSRGDPTAAQANLSQHLAVLRSQQIVKTRKAGNQVFYSVRDPVILKVLALLRRYLEKHLNEMLSDLGSELQEARR